MLTHKSWYIFKREKDQTNSPATIPKWNVFWLDNQELYDISFGNDDDDDS